MHPATSVRLGLVATLIGMAGDMAVVAMGGLDFFGGLPRLACPRVDGRSLACLWHITSCL